MATLEEASCCPICHIKGRLSGTIPGEKDSQIHTFICETGRCKWYGTGWIVQVLKDGSIPERTKGEPEFPELTDLSARRASADVARIRQSMPDHLLGQD